MTGRRVLMIASVLGLIVSIVGFVATLVLNAFVLDKYNAYGEVPIPGEASLHLPAGEVTVSFHTFVTGSPNSGFPVPPLGLTIKPPEGVADPVVTENWGTTTTVNSDTHIRVWVAQIPAEGTYRVSTDGKVNGYINPQLAFGHKSSHSVPIGVYIGVFVVSLVGLIGGSVSSARNARRPRPIALQEPPATASPDWNTFISGDPAPPSYSAPPSYTPTDDGVRIEQLKTLAALRDSGALTEAEFEAEKRRVLDAG